MNLLTAMLLLVVIATWAGQPTTTINKVIDGSPAYEACLLYTSPHILFQYCFKIQGSLRLMGLHHLYQEILDVDKTDLSVEEQIH